MKAKPLQEFARDYGVSMPTVYRLIKAGKLTAVKIGSRTFVTPEDEAAFKASLQKLPAKAA